MESSKLVFVRCLYEAGSSVCLKISMAFEPPTGFEAIDDSSRTRKEFDPKPMIMYCSQSCPGVVYGFEFPGRDLIFEEQ